MTEEKRKLLILAFSSLVVLTSLVVLFNRKPENLVGNSNGSDPAKIEKIRVILQINDGIDQTSLSVKLESNDSIYDLMEYFREKNQVKYELINYFAVCIIS